MSCSMKRAVSTLAPLERLLAGLLHYGTWVASSTIAVGFVLTLIHSNSGVSHPEMMVGMRIVTTGIVLFILLPVLRLMLMFGVFLLLVVRLLPGGVVGASRRGFRGAARGGREFFAYRGIGANICRFRFPPD